MACFKNIGYLEWYKELRQRKTKKQTDVANAAITKTLVDIITTNQVKNNELNTNFSILFQQEMKKMMKGKAPAIFDPTGEIELGNSIEFASKISNFCLFSIENRNKEVWIIDTGATNHMCHSLQLFDKISLLIKPKIIQLPDGSSRVVSHTGSISLRLILQLYGVLLVPMFQCNLLSMSKLAQTCQLSITFCHDRCVIQDL